MFQCLGICKKAIDDNAIVVQQRVHGELSTMKHDLVNRSPANRRSIQETEPTPRRTINGNVNC
jgi:hypothetical protein